MEQGKNTWRQTARGTCPNDCSANQLRSAGVRGMGFDHHRTAGGESASGVAASDRKRQWKVTGPKDNHHTEWLKYTPQVGAGQVPAAKWAGYDARRRARVVVCKRELDPGRG